MSRIDIDNNIMCYIDTNHNLYYAENDFINPKWVHIGPPCSSCAISNGKIIALPYIEKPESVLTKQGGSIELTPYFYFTNNYKSNIWKQMFIIKKQKSAVMKKYYCIYQRLMK